MNITFAFTLFSILLLGAPGYAQNPCADYPKAAQGQLKQCLSNAINQEDKKSCTERQQAKAKVCENGECLIERTTSQNNNDVLPQKK
jgi:hypothetical protein